MNWLERLKNKKTHEADASKTTETIFVVSVAPTSACLQKNEGSTAKVDDPALSATPLLLADPQTLDVPVSAADVLHGHDPDAHCWPHSSAMNGGEIELFQVRSVRFAERGLSGNESEAMAEKLVARDRDADDRRFCLECKHLSGYSQSSWRCGNWPTDGVAIGMRGRQLPADFVLQLHRCDGFYTATLNSTSTPF